MVKKTVEQNQNLMIQKKILEIVKNKQFPKKLYFGKNGAKADVFTNLTDLAKFFGVCNATMWDYSRFKRFNLGNKRFWFGLNPKEFIAHMIKDIEKRL
jgi:hypothetical protein